MTPKTEGYIYRADAAALTRWMLAQWSAWLAKGAMGFDLACAAALAPTGPAGDAARAAWQAGVEIKHAALTAAAKAKCAALVVRPGALGEPTARE